MQGKFVIKRFKDISKIDTLFNSAFGINYDNSLLYYGLCNVVFAILVIVYAVITVKQASEQNSLVMKVTYTVATILPIIFVLLIETQFCVFVFSIYQRFLKVNKILNGLFRKREHPLSEDYIFHKTTICFSQKQFCKVLVALTETID